MQEPERGPNFVVGNIILLFLAQSHAARPLS